MDINKKNRSDLKSYFVKNSIPTESNFAELIDGMLNQKDDGIVKLSGDPLSIEAAGDLAGLQKVINFYAKLQDANPAWSLQLNPRTDPNAPATAKAGFCVADGTGAARLFIDKTTGNVGIGTIAPIAKLDIAQAARTGTHPTAIKGLYITGDFGPDSDGIEFRHSNGSQGIGFGYATIYAAGSNPNQNLQLIPKGTGVMRVLGAANISNGNGVANAQNFMSSGSLTIGGINVSYGGGNNWSANTAGLLLETLANTEIAVHDSNTRLTSLMYYEGDTVNKITIGRNMGWGVTPVTIASNLMVNGNVAIQGNVDIKASSIKLGLEGNGGGQLILSCNKDDNKVFLEAFSKDGASSAAELLLTGRNAGSVPKLSFVADVTNITGNAGIGLASSAVPIAKLDIAQAARTGTHPTAIKGLYITGDFGEADGIEFRHSNATQGIGFGYNTIYATGSNANQVLQLKPKGTGALRVLGKANISDGSNLDAVENQMASGSLTIGSITSNYGGGNNWNANTAGLLLQTLANTEIAVHDSGTRIASLMYYEGDTVNKITIGRDMAWGVTPVTIASNLTVNGRLIGNLDYLVSSDGRWKLVMQTDRNLVMYPNAGGGAIWASNTSLSDISLKKNLSPINDALKKILSLRGFSFAWKDEDMGKNREIGVIAQDVEQVFPELVSTITDRKFVNYHGLIAALIEAMKEQQTQIDTLTAAVNL